MRDVQQKQQKFLCRICTLVETDVKVHGSERRTAVRPYSRIDIVNDLGWQRVTFWKNIL